MAAGFLGLLGSAFWGHPLALGLSGTALGAGLVMIVQAFREVARRIEEGHRRSVELFHSEPPARRVPPPGS